MAAISLCMIVKDEEAVLDRCLDCFGELADEIVIVDTGSSDRTKEIAGKYTSQVYGFPWCGDFSAARNYGLERATKEYCMWVDADDVMRQEDRRRFLEMKKTLPADTDVVLLPYETGFDSEGRPIFTYYRERIVRNSPEFRFAGRVHETIPLKGTLRYEEIPVVHRKESPGDPDRNLRIYEEMEKAGESFDSRALYYYGRELLTHGRYEKGAQILQAFLARPDGWVENRIDASRQLAHCFRGLGQEEKELDALLGALRYDVPRGETCCQLGRYFLEQGRYAQAVFWYEQALRARKDPASGAFIEEDCYGFLPAISLCVCYDRMGNLEQARRYNELAGRYKPESEYVVRNREYFEKISVRG
ncbi:MAG TPA: glycosyltransferase [Candidatus Dorea merdavium]|nr:glycosyltransferase [Candidatus Dorea merdavium]